MLSAELKNRIDRLWDAFDAEGMSNSREVIEQITYLMFIRRLDDHETRNEAKARWGAAPPMIFPQGDGQRLSLSE
ncbi:type I restriction-modification system subunit M N-terminal domain-containing protein [Nocardiopsis exhalans]|uniref:Type I restriction-modification system subunit M N-terminal domain-containing protein n=1 Tax=Nocardiopsis exhalans TaxID=163604 RepID=A0ABY5DDY9_9ACTN|nr:type I restriction-modification system subunit M N-terminal domain-containing protein [Nocardiopsis exhalans]USY22559.1 type I restriction-modification system subunit M N-terminal domain-containing protein [Nocardiopsis exhalans]